MHFLRFSTKFYEIELSVKTGCTYLKFDAKHDSAIGELLRPTVFELRPKFIATRLLGTNATSTLKMDS